MVTTTGSGEGAAALQSVCEPFKNPPDSTSYDVEPVPVKKVEVQYPDKSREAGIQGTVVLRAYIDVHGRVCWISVVMGIPVLTESAIEAVKQWEFSPATLKGVPVGAWFEIPVVFQL